MFSYLLVVGILASYSDSELPQFGPRRRTLQRVGSQENLLNTHTNAKYRRKHGECWRKADVSREDDTTDDEVEIEVDVKEEECLSDSGDHLMLKVSPTWNIHPVKCRYGKLGGLFKVLSAFLIGSRTTNI